VWRAGLCKQMVIGVASRKVRIVGWQHSRRVLTAVKCICDVIRDHHVVVDVGVGSTAGLCAACTQRLGLLGPRKRGLSTTVLPD
jgi:hypothetical protein